MHWDSNRDKGLLGAGTESILARGWGTEGRRAGLKAVVEKNLELGGRRCRATTSRKVYMATETVQRGEI